MSRTLDAPRILVPAVPAVRLDDDDLDDDVDEDDDLEDDDEDDDEDDEDDEDEPETWQVARGGRSVTRTGSCLTSDGELPRLAASFQLY